MSFKILHILDCYLPETMNWLEQLLLVSREECEHHVHAAYRISASNPNFISTNIGMESAYPIPVANKILNKLKFRTELNQLKKYAVQNNIQLIHFHFGHVAIRYEKLIEELQLPFCISLYGFDYEYLVHKVNSVKIKYLNFAALGGNFIVEGNYSKKLIIGYGIASGQVHIIHMLFKRLNRRNKLANYEQPIRLLQAATFTEKKNQLDLVKALQARHAGKFSIQFHGEKIDEHYYKELMEAVKLKYKHRISISDVLPFSEYISVLSTSHFSINLSKRSRSHDTEGGCPVFLKDGMSLGIPAITTLHCDIPELVIHQFNGYLLPENDEPAIIETLDELLRINESSYRKMQRNALETVSVNSVGLTKYELLQVYQNML